MQERDRDLGMGSNITRRDFLDGVAYVAGAAAITGLAGASAASAGETGSEYPPMRQGMRGFTDEAMAAGHAVRDGAGQGEPADTGEVYDLVIVGAGMAGLSAAYFYHKQYPDAKVLILEGCDDFGGNARRIRCRWPPAYYQWRHSRPVVSRHVFAGSGNPAQRHRGRPRALLQAGGRGHQSGQCAWAETGEVLRP
jgi:hypothetical protein